MSTNEQNENLDKAKQFVNDAESGLKDFTKQTQDAIGNLSDKVKATSIRKRMKMKNQRRKVSSPI